MCVRNVSNSDREWRSVHRDHVYTAVWWWWYRRGPVWPCVNHAAPLPLVTTAETSSNQPMSLRHTDTHTHTHTPVRWHYYMTESHQVHYHLRHTDTHRQTDQSDDITMWQCHIRSIIVNSTNESMTRYYIRQVNVVKLARYYAIMSVCEQQSINRPRRHRCTRRR